MDFKSEIIFFFSALGAFNGFLLAFYFFKAAKRNTSYYFLGFLLLALSIRIIKSTFFYFNPQLSEVFIQVGLSACFLIGPFLYLYLRKYHTSEKFNWAIHVFPYLIGITIFGALYSYQDNRIGWSRGIVYGIYFQWFCYIALSFKYVKQIFVKMLNTKEKLSNNEIWLASIFLGVAVIWFAYSTARFTSYLVGALSFSFVLYLIVLLFILRGRKSTFFEEKEKYKDKQIDSETIAYINKRIDLIKQKELFLNPDITLTETARALSISTHTLSQFLNESLGKSFSTFINEHRVEKAKLLLETNHNYTIESLGYESGFNSKSTFFSTFRKLTGQTPTEYRKKQIN